MRELSDIHSELEQRLLRAMRSQHAAEARDIVLAERMSGLAL